MTTDFAKLRAARQAARTPEQQAEYDKAYAEAALAGSLAELVYNLRDEAGITQTELARRMGTTQSSIARIESGGNTPTIYLLDKLGKALGTPLTLSAAGHAVTFGLPETTDPGTLRPVAEKAPAIGTTRFRPSAPRTVPRPPAGSAALAGAGVSKASAAVARKSKTAPTKASHDNR